MKIEEIKNEVNEAFETLRKHGVTFRERVNLYSLKAGDFFLGTYTGEQGRVPTKFGEQPYFVFDVIEGKATDKGGNRVTIRGKVGILANGSLKNHLTTELIQNGDEWEHKPIDRKGHKISVVYYGNEVKKVGKKTFKVGKYNFHDLTTESK